MKIKMKFYRIKLNKHLLISPGPIELFSNPTKYMYLVYFISDVRDYSICFSYEKICTNSFYIYY